VISNENIKKSIYSFGHLTGYGAAYYGYAWSEVYSEDMFQYIKKSGLLNPQMGDYYASTVLSKGGSCDPMNLLQDFLKRSPSTEAFFKSRGL
jgi:thimet oligopeptidase